MCGVWVTRATVAAVTNESSAPDGIDVSVTGEPDTGDLEVVKAGLVEFNARVAGFDKAVPMAVFARRDGVLVGGAVGFTHWEWLFIHYLWVSDELRGGGLGAHLLGTAEATARERGCGAVWLDTFSFQAPGFYKGLGYRQFGQLDDFPPGHARHFLWKPLS
jgi:GNAT superfamily N-acetyltransferase